MENHGRDESAPAWSGAYKGPNPRGYEQAMPVQIPSKKTAPIQVSFDSESLHRVLQPVLDELNAFRRRMEELETNMIDLVNRLADDGR